MASTFQKSGDPRKETKTVIRTVLTLSEWSAPLNTAKMVRKMMSVTFPLHLAKMEVTFVWRHFSGVGGAEEFMSQV